MITVAIAYGTGVELRVRGDRTVVDSLCACGGIPNLIGADSRFNVWIPLRKQPLEDLIHLIRGRRVMFDTDLAALYEVPTGALNQTFKRNRGRFPEDFAFQLSKDDLENWRSQIVI